MIKPCKDHLGNEYPSIKDMCKAYNIHPVTYKSRLEQGISQEEALTKPKKNYTASKRIQIEDHLGNKFSSLKAMCEFYNINPRTYRFRRESGKSIEEALTTPLQNTHIRKNKPTIDHEGNQFKSYSAMLKYWGIGDSTYKYRRTKLGWDMEKALTAPRSETHKPIKCGIEDHLGNKYRSLRSLCDAYGVPHTTYTNRIKRGMSQKEALTTPTRSAVTDHLGNKFSSEKKMCQYWDIPLAAYRGRIHTLNWDLETALTKPVRKMTRSSKEFEYITIENKKTITFFNKTFENTSKLCGAFNINQGTYTYRINAGWSQEEALGLIPHIKPNSKNLKINDSILIKEPIKTDSDIQYYSCDWNGEDSVMTRDIILNKAKTQLAASFA